MQKPTEKPLKVIATTKQSPAGMQQSCTHGPWQLFLLFPVNKVKNGKEEEEQMEEGESNENGEEIATTM